MHWRLKQRNAQSAFLACCCHSPPRAGCARAGASLRQVWAGDARHGRGRREVASPGRQVCSRSYCIGRGMTVVYIVRYRSASAPVQGPEIAHALGLWAVLYYRCVWVAQDRVGIVMTGRPPRGRYLLLVGGWVGRGEADASGRDTGRGGHVSSGGRRRHAQRVPFCPWWWWWWVVGWASRWLVESPDTPVSGWCAAS